LFDVKNFINEIGYYADIKDGFLFFLLCGKRPIQELLNPHLIDISAAFEKQFNGMTDISFGYDEYKTTRNQLIRMVNESLTPADKEFLLSFSKGEPDWTAVDYSKYPAIKWKLHNITLLKKNNPQKYAEQLGAIKQILYLP
jgi:hypothetical protein